MLVITSYEYSLAYEGADQKVTVAGLNPLTTYTFKLKFRFSEAEEWHKTSVEGSASTTDENLVTKVTTQLLRAIQDNNDSAVSQILFQHSKIINLDSRDKYGKTLLMVACQNPNTAVVTTLLRYGASTISTTQSGKTALSLAVTYDNLKAVQMLIDYGVDVNSVDQGGSTPLMWACDNANSNKHGFQIIDALVKAGARIDAEDGTGQTAFDRLCFSSGNVMAARLLLQSGAKLIQYPDRKHSMTSLMSAALNNHRELCRELMYQWNADPFATTEHGYTAKSFAESKENTVVVELLFQRMRQLEADMAKEKRESDLSFMAPRASTNAKSGTSAGMGG
ncbi:ankyrin repeat-containing domain protein [Polychytrium aggregatum]|uniref:ankyrin repeat-containing domain protein n=1 Tax=Polychytrium aggregatum TaxID=110093 RepID=UPI0022FDE695|nr:ankyrin repeat-containing domain protein [Polychytrium aggregatum]KAI9188477.1 ankyrin repeat-containing domain protein [Polychytrium aggregatum]